MARTDDPQMIADLQKFFDALGSEYSFTSDFTEDNRDRLLGLTGVAAHTIVRPAAPAASLAVGYLVGSGRAKDWGEAIDIVKRFVRAYVGDPAPAKDAE